MVWCVFTAKLIRRKPHPLFLSPIFKARLVHLWMMSGLQTKILKLLAVFFFRKNKLDALLGDFPILDYARAHLAPSCELKLISKLFGEDRYGLGLPKDSPLKVRIMCLT